MHQIICLPKPATYWNILLYCRSLTSYTLHFLVSKIKLQLYKAIHVTVTDPCFICFARKCYTYIQVQHFPAKQIKIELKQKLLTSWMLYTYLCNVLLTWKVLKGYVTVTCLAIYITTVASFYWQENAMYN